MKTLKWIIRGCLLIIMIGAFAGIACVFGFWGLLIVLGIISQIVILIQQSQIKKIIKELHEKAKS